MPTTPDMTVTVIAGERFTRTGDIAEFRRNLDLRVVDAGVTAATMYAALWHRGTKVAEFTDWEDGEDQVVSTASLNTTPLEAIFEDRAATAQVGLELRISTGLDEDLIASGIIPCRNNPPEGFDPPADLDTVEYLKKSDFDANDDNVIDEDALPPVYTGSGAAIARDSWTLTAQNISDKYLALTYTPDRKLLQLVIESGSTPVYGEDFTVTAATRRLSWDALGLDGLLIEGDKLLLEYTYTPEE